MIGEMGLVFRQEYDISLLSSLSRQLLGSAQMLIPELTEALSQGLEWLGREVHHSPPSSAEVKNAWRYKCSPPPLPRLHGVALN